jgi:hypothetical protein
MVKTKDTFLIDPKEYNDDVKLLGAEIMKSRKEAGRKTKQDEIRSEYSIGEIKRFAQMTIDDRMKFCRDYKKDEPFDKCVCEAIERYIRLFKDSSMKGDKHLTKLRLEAIRKLFDEMKKEGKIKCTDNNVEKNEKNDSQPKQPV